MNKCLRQKKLRHGYYKKCICLLYTSPDAKEYAINLALKLVAYKKVKVVFLPDGKDVNDLGRSQTLKLVYATRPAVIQLLILLLFLLAGAVLSSIISTGLLLATHGLSQDHTFLVVSVPQFLLSEALVHLYSLCPLLFSLR